MLFRTIKAFYGGNYTEHIKIFCGENTAFSDFKDDHLIIAPL
jgi:hypothetical protein